MTRHRSYFTIGLSSHNPALSDFIFFMLLVSFMFTLLNNAKKSSSISYWLIQEKSKGLLLQYYLTSTLFRWEYVLTVQRVYFFPTEKKSASRVKIASSCISCPRGQSITQNPLLYLLILNTARACENSGPGLGEGDTQHREMSGIPHTRPQHALIAL